MGADVKHHYYHNRIMITHFLGPVHAIHCDEDVSMLFDMHIDERKRCASEKI